MYNKFHKGEVVKTEALTRIESEFPADMKIELWEASELKRYDVLQRPVISLFENDAEHEQFVQDLVMGLGIDDSNNILYGCELDSTTIEGQKFATLTPGIFVYENKTYQIYPTCYVASRQLEKEAELTTENGLEFINIKYENKKFSAEIKVYSHLGTIYTTSHDRGIELLNEIKNLLSTETSYLNISTGKKISITTPLTDFQLEPVFKSVSEPKWIRFTSGKIVNGVKGTNEFLFGKHNSVSGVMEEPLVSRWDGLITRAYKNNSITNSKLYDMAGKTVKGRKDDTSGDPEDITRDELVENYNLVSQDDNQPINSTKTFNQNQIIDKGVNLIFKNNSENYGWNIRRDANLSLLIENGGVTPSAIFTIENDKDVSFNVKDFSITGTNLSFAGKTDISGNIFIKETDKVGGGKENGELDVEGKTSLKKSLTVTGATTLNDTLTVATGKATTLSGTLGVTGATTLNNTLTVATGKDTTLGGTLKVAGATTLNDTLTVATGKATTLGGTLGVTGATALGGTLGVTGATTLSGTLGVAGATTLSETLTVATGKVTTLGGALGVTGATTLSGTLGVTGATTLNDTLTVATGKATTLGGTLEVTGATTLNDTLTVATGKDTTLGGTLKVTGATTLNNTLTVATGKVTTLGGTLKVTGATTLNNTLTVATGKVTTLGGALGVTGATTLSGTLGVAGATTLSETLTVATGKATTLGGTLEVTGATTLNNTLTVATGKDTTLGGALKLNEKTFSISLGKKETTGYDWTVSGAEHTEVKPAGIFKITSGDKTVSIDSLSGIITAPGFTNTALNTLNVNKFNGYAIVDRSTTSSDSDVNSQILWVDSNGLEIKKTTFTSLPIAEYTRDNEEGDAEGNNGLMTPLSLKRIKDLEQKAGWTEEGGIIDLVGTVNGIEPDKAGGNVLIDSSDILVSKTKKTSGEGGEYESETKIKDKIDEYDAELTRIATHLPTDSGTASANNIIISKAGTNKPVWGQITDDQISNTITKVAPKSTTPTDEKEYGVAFWNTNTNGLHYDEDVTYDPGNNTLTATNVNSRSSRKLKKDIEIYTKSAFDTLDKIDVVSFHFKDDITQADKVGFIAEDSPSLVAGLNYDKMDINNCVGLLIKAVQELKEENKELRNAINKLRK